MGVRALPGVEAAGVVRVLPLATTIGDYGLDVEGYEERPGAGAKGDWQIVSDGAFEAMGTRLVRGRWFTAGDTSESQLVAVVNETLARQYFRDGSAVGGRLRVGNMKNPWAVVVGIVADERHNGVTGLVKEKFYIPHSQWHVVTGGNLVRNAFVVVRTSGDPMALAAADSRRGPRARCHAADRQRPADDRCRRRRRSRRRGSPGSCSAPSPSSRCCWPPSASTVCSRISSAGARTKSASGSRLAPIARRSFEWCSARVSSWPPSGLVVGDHRRHRV